MSAYQIIESRFVCPGGAAAIRPNETVAFCRVEPLTVPIATSISPSKIDSKAKKPADVGRRRATHLSGSRYSYIQSASFKDSAARLTFGYRLGCCRLRFLCDPHRPLGAEASSHCRWSQKVCLRAIGLVRLREKCSCSRVLKEGSPDGKPDLSFAFDNCELGAHRLLRR
jgi:hypothetical protein